MKHPRGFTLVEMIVTMGILSVLLTFASVSLLGVQNQTTLSSVLALLAADVRQQQLKAVNGDTSGSATAGSYGIYFAADTYTLFHGSVYSSSDPSNFSVSTGGEILFTDVTLPGSQVVFSPVNGEILNYDPASSGLNLTDPHSAESVILRFNRYGTLLYP